MTDFWSECLLKLRESLSEDIVRLWFGSITADETNLSSGSVILFVESLPKARQIQKTYGDLLDDVMRKVSGMDISIQWVAKKEELPIFDADKAEKPTFSSSRENSAEQKEEQSTGLLPELTFENIIQGNANQLAYAAALQVANNARPIYNPLFIYGGVGLGKTHLMHALGHRYAKQHPQAKILCISAQQFMDDFLRAIKKTKSDSSDEEMNVLEKKLHGLDLLLIDDIQSLQGREGTQNYFFTAFEKMVPKGKQIVLTSDTYPTSLKNFQDRVKSRLTQGLVVSVEPPELEMRIQILVQKAQRCGLNLSHEIATLIAKKLKNNVRELEGAVQQIHAYTNFHQISVTMDSVQRALRDIFKISATPVTVEKIQQTVAEYYNIKIADIFSKSRAAQITKPRQIAMYLSKEMTQLSLPEIGKLFGGRDHTTVLYAARKVASDAKNSESLKHDLHILEQRIRN